MNRAVRFQQVQLVINSSASTRLRPGNKLPVIISCYNNAEQTNIPLARSPPQKRSCQNKASFCNSRCYNRVSSRLFVGRTFSFLYVNWTVSLSVLLFCRFLPFHSSSLCEQTHPHENTCSQKLKKQSCNSKWNKCLIYETRSSGIVYYVCQILGDCSICLELRESDISKLHVYICKISCR